MSALRGKSWAWLGGAFVISLLVVGWPYWHTPYAKVSLPDSLYGGGLVIVAVLAALTRAVGRVRFWAALVVVGAAVPFAVLARVAVDTSKDPTSHNLWPIELVLAAAVGMTASLVGALLGSLPAFIARRKNVD